MFDIDYQYMMCLLTE